MIVERIIDDFPVGMRVLAVDDDPTCLMLLETLLTKCQYYVETTNRADKALEMLRDSKKKFDLVISDVHMPDMDGFKLLELVGLEMDLPVIMLSANGDNKLVMKGITHGACDYLLKPVRIEELKNIWQHVIRKKKIDSKDEKYFDKFHGDCGEGGEGLTGDYHQNGKLNRKRKDQNDDEDEEHNENGHNNEDPSTQKKPRVVWSVDLHRKFVAAVHHLGIDKAVPKKILDLMNVEKLTRENVASHLQKYRLYLKRISCVASQQANMISALGSENSAYLQMASLNGLGDGSAQFQNAAYRPFSPSSVLGRQNTPLNGLTNFHQGGTILQGMPMSLQLDQLQHNQGATSIDSLVYPKSSDLSDTKLNVGSSSKFLFGVPNNPLMIEGHLQDAQTRGGFPPHLPDFIQFQTTSLSGNGGQNSNFTLGQDAVPQLNILSGSMDSSISPHGVVGLFDRRWDSRNTMYQMNENFNVTGQVNFVNPLSMQHNEVGQSALETALKLKQGNLKEQGSYGPNRVDSLEDLVSLMMKQV